MLESRKTIEGLAAEVGMSVDGARESLARELREIRAGLPSHGKTGEISPRTPGGWAAALYEYDEALVIAAHLLGVEGAPPLELFIGIRRLTELERHLLESGMAELGIDLRPRLEIGRGY